MPIARSRVRFRASSLLLVSLGAVSATACLSRPTVSEPPTTKTVFESKVTRRAVDKIDLVLSVDNSGSMGDKQAFLAKAVPLLVKRFITPRCVPKGRGVADDTKLCAAEEDVEYHPIEDIHVAVVTSSLGGFGSSSFCLRDAKRADDDRGLPIRRALDEGGKAVDIRMEKSGFLAWLPPTEKNASKPKPENPYSDEKDLGTAIASLVRGAGERGCGFEAQLESVYRFLVQPDPWESIVVESDHARYQGIANDVLAARKDFLRSDSLVAVIMLTDEDDSSVDPLSIGGTGWAFMREDRAPRATSICATNPASPDCTSCAFGKNEGLPAAQRKRINEDPSCLENGGVYLAADDSTNVRFHRMKQRFGVDPQYPLQRYVSGFTAPIVPHRLGEHELGSGEYVGNVNGLMGCTNPLFAKTLPTAGIALSDEKSLQAANAGGKLDWCKLPRSDERDESLVFFAVVGGVPNELLHFDPSDPEKSELTEEDWVKIVGKDPTKYDDGGLDIRMLQATTPRPGRRAEGADAPVDDPLNTDHRDYKTGGHDLEYACTFPLPESMQRTPTSPNDPTSDCLANSDAPLCGGTTDKPRKQIRAKAYPTLRELAVARLLGTRGIAASLCPRQIDGKEDDALYGYNPAVAAIANRLGSTLTAQCLPRPLGKDDAGEVSCLMIERLAEDDRRACKDIPGRSALPADIEEAFRAEDRSQSATGSKRTLCKLEQLKVPAGETCRFSAPGWCYAEKAGSKAPVGKCSQAIVFSDKAIETAKGATVDLQCIDQKGAGSGQK